MKKNMVVSLSLALIIGIFSGWFANAFWEVKILKAKSVMALVHANEAANARDWDKATEYAIYALAYDDQSPLAGIQMKEFSKKRIEKCGAIPDKERGLQ